MNRHMRRKMNRLRMVRGPMEIQGMDNFGDPNGFGQGDGNTPGGGGNQQRQPNQQPGNNGNGNGDGFQYGNTPGPIFGQDDDNGDSEIDDIIKAFQAPDGNDDSQPDFQPMEDVAPERITEMQQRVADQINNMQLPENFLPQDFDPSNPQQLNQAFRSVMQHTLRNALNVVFQPTQLAMQSMSANFMNAMNQKFADTKHGQKELQTIESLVPEYSDPRYASMVKPMDDALKARGKKPEERAQTLRKVLNQMGIKSDGNPGQQRRTSNPNQPSGGVTTGKTALDKFFGGFGGNGR